MIMHMAQELMNTWMVQDLSDSGKWTSNMVMVSKCGLMVVNMKVIINLEKNMA